MAILYHPYITMPRAESLLKALQVEKETRHVDERVLKFISRVFGKATFPVVEMETRVRGLLIRTDMKLDSKWSQNEEVVIGISRVFGEKGRLL